MDSDLEKEDERSLGYRIFDTGYVILNLFSFGLLHKLVAQTPTARELGADVDYLEGRVDVEETRAKKAEESLEKLQGEHGAAVAEMIGLQGTVGKQAADIANLERKLNDALENDFYRHLGRHVWDESQCGAIHVNSNNKVDFVNENACQYLGGAEPSEVIGRKLSELSRGNEYFGNYMAFFEGFGETKMKFEPNTFKIENAVFGVSAYATFTDGEYRGGFIVLTPPPVSEGLVKKMVGVVVNRWKGTVEFEGALNQDMMLQKFTDYIIPIANLGKKYVYFDMGGIEMVERGALRTLAKGYELLTKQGATCVFNNVPSDVARYLRREAGVEKQHVKRIKAKQEALATGGEIADYLARKSLEKNRTGNVQLEDGLTPEPAT